MFVFAKKTGKNDHSALSCLRIVWPRRLLYIYDEYEAIKGASKEGQH